MTINEFFTKHELSAVEVFFSVTHGDFRAVLNSNVRAIRQPVFGTGDSPDAALTDLMMKANSSSVTRQKPAPVAQQEPEASDELDGLLG